MLNSRISVLLALSSLVISGAQRQFVINIFRIECRHFIPEYIKGLDCHLEERNNKNEIFASIILAKSIPSFYLRNVFQVDRPNRQTVKLIDFTFDGCQLSETLHEQYYYRPFLKFAELYANEIPRCPMKPNFTYFLHNAIVNENDFPEYIPEMKFRVVFEVYEKQGTSKLAYLKVDGSVARNKTTNKEKRKKSG